jgi:hypothetical protein
MKKLEEYSWDQLNSYRYDVYPYRLIVVSPLEYEKIKFHFREFISDSSIKKKYDFAEYLQHTTGEPAIAAMFYEDSICNKRKEIFSEIATMTQRVKSFTLFA